MMRRLSGWLCYAFGIGVILLAFYSNSAVAGVPATWTSTSTVGCSLPTTRTFTGTLTNIAQQWIGVFGVGSNIGCGNNYSFGYVDETNGGMFFQGYPAGSFWIFATSPTCVAPATHSSSTGMCEDPVPPTCPAGQSGNPCTPTAPEPLVGDGRDISVEVCRPPTDCSAQSNWTPWAFSVNDGGWIYSASSPSSCVQDSGTGVVSCNTNTVYQGAGPATDGLVVAGNSVVGGTNAIQNTCSTGYVYDAVADRCLQSTGGAATTTTTAGTAPVTSNSCPVGYAADASGACVSATQNAYACPDGYIKGVDGRCASQPGTVSAVYGAGAGSGANAVSSCGGPGQPPCSVKVVFDESIPAAEGLLSVSNGISSVTAVNVGGPVASCPAPVQLAHGIVWSWNTVCNFASFLRPIVLALAWLSAGMMVLGAGKAEI